MRKPRMTSLPMSEPWRKSNSLPHRITAKSAQLRTRILGRFPG